MKFEDVLNLIIPEQFGCDEENCETAAMEEVEAQLDRNNTTFYGASQFVIIFKDMLDKVVKIPFSGEYVWYDDEEDYVFDHFQTNYSNLSVNLYNKAKYADIDCIFAKTEFLGYTKNGEYPIYTQERIKESYADSLWNKESHYEDPSQSSLAIVRDHSNSYSYAWRTFAENWLAQAIDAYGIETIEKAMNFLDENGIEDLHRANYGYRFDGTPVIFDYCGFDY